MLHDAAIGELDKERENLADPGPTYPSCSG
jgi:hypothetical protein